MDLEHQRGFTLMEILVVVAIIGTLMASGFFMIRNARIDAEMKNSRSSLVHAIEESKNRSMAGAGSDAHGLRIEKNRIIMFEGSSYSGTGEEIYFSPRVKSNLTDKNVVFSRISGTPSEEVEITLTHSAGETDSIIMTAKGVIINE